MDYLHLQYFNNAATINPLIPRLNLSTLILDCPNPNFKINSDFSLQNTENTENIDFFHRLQK